ncbi:MAG: hypothetical protein JST89_14475 [Cyanobacteria bacterium SZAS-4]|nr:hypothetical protein [Cyanobacteria bacterium SZAS-4]
MNNSVPATVKSPGQQLLVFRGALLGLLIGAGISVVPICGIRRSADLVLSEPTQVILFIEWIIVSAITGGALLPKLILGDPLLKSFPETTNRFKRLFKQLIMPISALVFLLLYFAASGLCQRLDMGVVHGDSTTTQIFRYFGLLIASAGLGIQAYALLASARTKQDEEAGTSYMRCLLMKLRHPCFFAALVALTGIPIAMGTWYPLFAIPGIFIVMKWIVSEQEKMLVERFGERYILFQAGTKRLLPYIY